MEQVMMMYAAICSNNINRILHARDLSVRQLALAIGVSPSTMADALKSQKGVSINLLVRIAAFFGVTPGQLCSQNLTEKDADDGALLKRYAALDKHGKEMIQLVLDKEYERVNKAALSFAAAARVGQPLAEDLSPKELTKGLSVLDRLAEDGSDDSL